MAACPVVSSHSEIATGGLLPRVLLEIAAPGLMLAGISEEQQALHGVGF